MVVVKNKAVKILFIDDNKDIRKSMRQMLKNKGFAVKGCANNKQALQKAARRRPDIIILDISLPDLHGLETCNHLRGNPATRNIPIIFLSAKRYIAKIVRYIPGAVVECINKPCNIQYLLKRIDRLVGK